MRCTYIYQLIMLCLAFPLSSLSLFLSLSEPLTCNCRLSLSILGYCTALCLPASLSVTFYCLYLLSSFIYFYLLATCHLWIIFSSLSHFSSDVFLASHYLSLILLFVFLYPCKTFSMRYSSTSHVWLNACIYYSAFVNRLEFVYFHTSILYICLLQPLFSAYFAGSLGTLYHY